MLTMHARVKNRCRILLIILSFLVLPFMYTYFKENITNIYLHYTPPRFGPLPASLKAENGRDEDKVFGSRKDCKAYFNGTRYANMKRLLLMKTTPEVETLLYRLGYPKRFTANGDVYFPSLPDPLLHTPDIPVVVTAASSNHYREMQGLLENIDTVLRPGHPDIKVIIYDIGFTDTERQAIIRYGRAELRTFDFKKYPDHFRYLHTCSWKPVIIQEVLNEFGFSMYMDTSIRLESGNISQVVRRIRESGMLVIPDAHPMVNLTFAKTFDYFRVDPCLFHGINEIQAGFNLAIKNNLNTYVIMRSWLTCVLQKRCVMPIGAERITYCQQNIRRYHKCHRNDQSALGLSLFMLFHHHDRVPYITDLAYKVRRGQVVNYFSKITHTD